MKLLEVTGLAKRYGSRQVVNEVSFDVDAGEIVGLLGPNGAGKTTSFRMTCGMVTPDRGRVVLDGQDVTSWPMHRRAREGGLGYLPQQSSVFGKLTVEQNLVATMQLLGRPSGQRRRETAQLLAEFGLEHIRSTLSAQVSGGERRRLEIARCLVSNPKMIMLDEPFAGIDPVTVQGIQGIIRQLADRGLGILITDHAAREILQITSRTYVISEGEVLCSGSPHEVSIHPEVRKKYLGTIDSFEPTTRSPQPTRPRPASTPQASTPQAITPQATTRQAASPQFETRERPGSPTSSALMLDVPDRGPEDEFDGRDDDGNDHDSKFIPSVPMSSVPDDFFRQMSGPSSVVFAKPAPSATQTPPVGTVAVPAPVPMSVPAHTPLVMELPESPPLEPQFAPRGRRFFPQPKTIRQGP